MLFVVFMKFERFIVEIDFSVNMKSLWLGLIFFVLNSCVGAFESIPLLVLDAVENQEFS